MLEREHAELLMAKAAQDEYVLALDQIPLEIFGFHAQQAAEKMLKAVLAARSVAYPPVHVIATLIDFLKRQGVAFPEELEEIASLTIFAVIFRYELLPEESEPMINMPEMRTLIGKLRAWAETEITVSLKNSSD